MRLRTYAALGPLNLARVALYRAALRAKIHPSQSLAVPPPVVAPFFRAPVASAPDGAIPRTAWDRGAEYFGRPMPIAILPPDWLANPYRTGARANGDAPWWQVPTFDPDLGDIKTVWEASRFDWVIAMAQRAACGRADEIDRLNAWLEDWSDANPPYRGVNWICGQEASIRVMHLAVAALILGQIEAPEAALVQALEVHLSRIAPTMSYAIGQQNNHATSEAAALFIGGSWLASRGDARARGWAATGRRGLEALARTLFEPDGTFSQYSVTYHRVALDAYCLAEAWRRALGLDPFGNALRARLAAAAEWLRHLTDPTSGDAPNLGANDGARLIPLTDDGYRDFRPSVQLAQALFLDRAAYAELGVWDQPLLWLRVAKPETPAPAPTSRSFDEGGLHVLRAVGVTAYLRYPRFRFRPSQADALHLDLWTGDEALLRDAGTYSYNAGADTLHFSGTEAHNTITMDGRDQMPRLGRFLFGDWLKTRDVETVRAEADGSAHAAAGYRDGKGAFHTRRVRLSPGLLHCEDTVGGFAERAVLRWRLAPGNWRRIEGGVVNGARSLIVRGDGIGSIALLEGAESLYYLEKRPLPVLEVMLKKPGTVTTEVRF